MMISYSESQIEYFMKLFDYTMIGLNIFIFNEFLLGASFANNCFLSIFIVITHSNQEGSIREDKSQVH